MKFGLAFFLSILFIDLAFASENHYEVGLNSRYVSNPYYLNQGPSGDFVFSVLPRVDIGNGSYQKGGSFLNAEVGYYKYATFANQDYYDFDIGGQWAIVDNHQATQWLVFADTELVSEAPKDEDLERRERIRYGGGTKIRIAGSDTSHYTFWARYDLETQMDTLYQHLNNYEAQGGLSYFYWFLPETALIFGFDAGTKIYPSGNDPDDDVSWDEKRSSIYYYPYATIEGRLGPTTSARASGGYLFRNYEKDPEGEFESPSFNEPIFQMMFEEQVSLRDVLSAGYDYTVRDTYYTNYVVDQTIFLGYGRILGDKILFLTRLSYSTLSYSLPTRREDQRVLGNFSLEYSMSSKIKLSGEMLIDFLNSDSRENLFTTGGATTDADDPAISYDYVHLGFTLKYVF